MSHREARHAYRATRRARRWASPERALFNSLFGGAFVILLGSLLYLAASGAGGSLVTWANFWTYLLMGLGALLVVRGVLELLAGHHSIGNIIGGIVLLVIGAAGLTLSLGGWSRYLWIAIIIVGGLLIILIGLLTYLLRK